MCFYNRDLCLRSFLWFVVYSMSRLVCVRMPNLLILSRLSFSRRTPPLIFFLSLSGSVKKLRNTPNGRRYLGARSAGRGGSKMPALRAVTLQCISGTMNRNALHDEGGERRQRRRDGEWGGSSWSSCYVILGHFLGRRQDSVVASLSCKIWRSGRGGEGERRVEIMIFA